MLRKVFEQVWSQLRAKKPQMPQYLERVRVGGMHGIKTLTVPFQYPVSVLAGANASGKSTVLFAAACAYAGGGQRYFPTTVFPDFRGAVGLPSDPSSPVELEFGYSVDGQQRQMRWARGKGNRWNRSFFGRKRGEQPKRDVYLRTLANLTNPSEVRSVLQLARRNVRPTTVSAELLAFAHRILPMRYAHLVLLQSGPRDLLFAQREDGQGYSEFHMSAGERAVLRLSKELSGLRNALVLVDEVEAGLHPFTQQQLMLELQRLALRNDLQIVVTTHSPVVLDGVPPEARLFLERVDDDVVLIPPHRDLMQHALYGQPLDRLSVLCEDAVAESLLRGVLDQLGPKMRLTGNIEVGRDTGKAEFAGHVRTLGRFRRIDSTLFVLDGDARDLEAELRKTANDFGQALTLLFLPGAAGPEAWVWERLLARPDAYAAQLGGISGDALRTKMRNLDLLYGGAADKPAAIAKNRLGSLADDLTRSEEDVCRIVGRYETEAPDGAMVEFALRLEEAIQAWRTRTD